MATIFDMFHQSHADAHTKANQALGYLHEILEELRQDDEDTSPVHRRMFNQVASAAGGTVDVQVGITPAGGLTEISRLSVKGSPTTVVEFYLDSPGDGILVDAFVTNAQGSYADGIAGSIWVRENRQLWARLYAQTAGQNCQAWAQIILHMENPPTNVVA